MASDFNFYHIRRVSGVRNDLRVVWTRAEAGRTAAPTPSDSELNEAILKDLRRDGRIDNVNDVKVRSHHGSVTLTGTVPNYYQKLIAQQDAESINGVQWVSSLLQVKGSWREDKGIDMDITEALQSDNLLIRDRIAFYVSEGVVTLKGSVNSEFEKSRIEKDIARIVGVKGIHDFIVVDWLPRYSDNALKSSIFEQLAGNWETWLLLNRIAIDVTDGKVTLKGMVDRWSQIKEAGRVTSQINGVLAVDNQLTIQGPGRKG
jgi:osmotically-inducible protein OsmY